MIIGPGGICYSLMMVAKRGQILEMIRMRLTFRAFSCCWHWMKMIFTNLMSRELLAQRMAVSHGTLLQLDW